MLCFIAKHSYGHSQLLAAGRLTKKTRLKSERDQIERDLLSLKIHDRIHLLPINPPFQQQLVYTTIVIYIHLTYEIIIVAVEQDEIYLKNENKLWKTNKQVVAHLL